MYLSRCFSLAICGLVAVAATADVAFAQSGSWGGGVRLLNMPRTRYELATLPEVQAALKLNDAQKKLVLVFGRTVTNGTCQSKSPAVGIGITCTWSSLPIGVIAFATCSFWQLYLKLAKQSHWIEAIGSRASLLCLITFT